MNRRNWFETPRKSFLKKTPENNSNNLICCKNFVVVILIPGQTTWLSEAATRGYLQKKIILKILQILQESTCARVSF